MAYLRPLGPLRPPPSAPASDHACLEAFDRELDYLFETLRRLGARPRDIEDLAQDVFVVLHRQWPTLDLTRPLRPYLFGVAFRVVAANRRRRRREVAQAAIETEDEAESPERAMEAKEWAALLSAALDRLPLRRRAVLVMHDIDQIPVAEVARILALTRFGTYARLRKGRQELAQAVRRLLRQDVSE